MIDTENNDEVNVTNEKPGFNDYSKPLDGGKTIYIAVGSKKYNFLKDDFLRPPEENESVRKCTTNPPNKKEIIDVPIDVIKKYQNSPHEVKPPKPVLNISQEIADMIEIDIKNPSGEDQHISSDLDGNQMYFNCYMPDNYV
jgi:hypothetical protein